MNSIPKSGTHLLKQVVLGIPHTFHRPDNIIYEGGAKDHKEHRNRLVRLNDNEMIMGHIHYSERWAKMLQRLKVKQVFIIRDPRDILVSLTYYICNHLPDYLLYDLFTKEGMTQKERYLTLIEGVNTESLKYANFNNWLNQFLGWRKDPHTLTVTYEDLMRSKASRYQTISGIANYLWSGLEPPMPMPILVDRMSNNIQPQVSPTFRKGKIGGWVNEFDEDVKAAFKRIAGNLLIELGYEKDLNW